MSVQLILKPQNVQGFTNDISYITSDMVANGATFTGVDSATGYIATSGNVIPEILSNAPATIPNTWYKFKQTASVSFPTTNGGNLLFTNDPESTLIGIYQQLTDLIIGQVYTVTFYTTTSDYVFFVNTQQNTTTMNGVIAVVGSSNVKTMQFTAEMTNPMIICSAANPGASVTSVTVSGITVVGASASINILSGDGQVICDLYENEDLPLTLSVDEFKNVAEKVQSYSKAFKLPATKRNNRIFDTIFEITRAYDGIIFSPYKRTQCILKQDGFILFEGFLRLLDITEKEQEISYNVNLYSEVVALADVLKDKTFSELDFSELDHSYTYSNIRNSWQGLLPVAPLPAGSFAGAEGAVITGVLKYPFINWNHQFEFTTSGRPKITRLENVFRPCIRLKYLIDNIFADPTVPFTYSSDFFNSSEFNYLFMDFNWGSDNAPLIFDGVGELTTFYAVSISNTFPPAYVTLGVIERCEIPGGSEPCMDSNFGFASSVFTVQEENQQYIFDYEFIFDFFEFGTEECNLNVEWVVAGVVINPSPTILGSPSNLEYTYSGNFVTGGNAPSVSVGDTIFCRVKTEGFSPPLSMDFWRLRSGFISFPSNIATLCTITTSINQTTTNTLLGTLRGELGQWDFLKGLMTMFNLVTLIDEDNPNNIIIEPYGDIFIPNPTAGQTLANRGIVHDWTDKIDVSQMKLTPLTDLNKNTIFKFVEDDDDYAFNRYKTQSGGHLYGSENIDADITDFNILDGEKEIIAEPFGASVVKPIMEQYPDIVVPSIYSYNEDDGTSEGFDNSPRIMYNNYVVDMSTTYSVPAQNGGVGNANESQYLQFSHLSEIPSTSSTRDLHFGSCQLMPNVGTPTANNLFSLYWQPYFNELYNPDTRIMTIKVNLNPADISNFRFNDKVQIKNRTFRVNKIDYKPNNLATVEFILIP